MQTIELKLGDSINLRSVFTTDSGAEFNLSQFTIKSSIRDVDRCLSYDLVVDLTEVISGQIDVRFDTNVCGIGRWAWDIRITSVNEENSFSTETVILYVGPAITEI